MPNYDNKRPYFVKLSNGLHYVYDSNAVNNEASIDTKFGITELTSSNIPVGAYAKGNPKPRRASLPRATGGTVNSFISSEKISAARQDGARISKFRQKRAIHALNSTLSRVVTVYVITGGIKRAWNMDKDLYDRIGNDLTALGINLATGADIPTLVWGCDYPYPGRAQLTVQTSGEDGEKNTYETFCSDAKANDGNIGNWKIVSTPISIADYYFDGSVVTP